VEMVSTLRPILPVLACCTSQLSPTRYPTGRPHCEHGVNPIRLIVTHTSYHNPPRLSATVTSATETSTDENASSFSVRKRARALKLDRLEGPRNPRSCRLAPHRRSLEGDGRGSTASDINDPLSDRPQHHRFETHRTQKQSQKHPTSEIAPPPAALLNSEMWIINRSGHDTEPGYSSRGSIG